MPHGIAGAGSGRFAGGRSIASASSWIESNVYREQTIELADETSVWTFQFDGRNFALGAGATARAFIKILDPAQGWKTTRIVTLNTTSLPPTWGTYPATWDGRRQDGGLAAAGVYQCVLETPSGRQSRRLALTR